MTELHRVSELGFADFVAMLLVETLDAIVASHSSQEERLRALAAAAEQGLDEFAENIAPEVIDGTVAELFPDGSGGTALRAGGEVPSPEGLARLGIVLTRAAVRDNTLTAAGVDQIREGVRRYLAVSHRESLQEVAQRGVPRVHVDGGVLRSKLTFSAMRRDDDEEAEEGPTRLDGPGRTPQTLRDPSLLLPTLPPRVGVPRLVEGRYLPVLQRGVLDSIARTRLTVTPAAAGGSGGGADDGDGNQTSATIYGEVEIHFHTER